MKLRKKGILASAVTAGLFIILAALFGVGELVVSGMTADLHALYAGERWAPEEPYATITLHTDEDAALGRNQAERYAASIESALLQNSIESTGNSSVWAYTYYTETLLDVNGPKAAGKIQTMAAAGSFFTFHPLDFRYGAPFSADDRSLPYVAVLDEEAAWQLFGAVDVVGMEMEVGGQTVTVTGIVRRERDTAAYTKAYGDSPRMYMSYFGYENIFGAADNITTYEAVLPNPVKSFALNIFRTAVNVQEDQTVLQENSARYTFANRFARMQELPYMGMRNDRIMYPYFENELRVIDYRTSVWMTAEITVGVLAVLSLLVSIILLFASGFSVPLLIKLGWQRGEAAWKQHRQNTGSRRRHHRRKKHRPETRGISGV